MRYEAVLDLAHHVAQPLDVAEVPVAQLPGAVLPYIYPSRYCESDRLHRLAVKEFGHLPQGYTRVQAICNWVTATSWPIGTLVIEKPSQSFNGRKIPRTSPGRATPPWAPNPK